MRARILSTVVLAPLFLAAIWFGQPYFEICVGILAIVALTELLVISAGDWRSKLSIVIIVLYAVSLVAIVMQSDLVAFLAAVAGAILAFGYSRSESGNRYWAGCGVLYLLLAIFAIFEMRQWPVSGRDWIFWFFAVVWAADIGAYLVGKSIGGVKLAPAISPGKTWSGTIGGLLVAIAVSAAFSATLLSNQSIVEMLLLGAVVAVGSQIGDLLESYYKRMNDVKDSGNIIPGHGGVLDRIDGVLLAAPVAWLLIPALAGGTP